MGWFDRDDDRRDSRQSTSQGNTTDEQAVERYRYMLRTAPPETIEQAHQEAFSRLTPEQRRIVLEQLSAEAPPEERRRASDDPASLARLATRTEMRQPGMLERILGASRMGGGYGGGVGFGGGMPGFGGMLAGSLLGAVAGSFIASSIAHSFFDSHPFQGADNFMGDASGGDNLVANEDDMGLGPDGYDNAGAETIEADYGDFGGGDFGGGDIEI
jgi:hypothetical protein